MQRQAVGVIGSKLRTLARSRGLQLLALAALLSGTGLICFRHELVVRGSDTWWHLKVGDWMVQHHTFPHNGILSRTAADRPWAAYSWGYEVLLSRAYAWFGLVGIGLYGAALTLLVAFSVFWMTRRLWGRFWPACLLSIVCCYAFLLVRIVPRPGFFSMALFCVLLALGLEANRTGNVQKLYWLPLVFLFWANLHIQFVYGLGTVGLLLAVNIVERLGERAGFAPSYLAPRSLPTASVAIIFILCVLATIIGPYSYHLYDVIFHYAEAKVPYAIVLELQPFRFRFHSNYVQVLLELGALVAVVSQKKIDLFKLALLIVAGVFAYRTMRDNWFQCIAAVACIADVAFQETKSEPRESPLQLGAVFAAVALILALGARSVGLSERGLRNVMNATFPVYAVNFLRLNPPPGPIWNIFDWGGFLSWYAPEYPVAIDGRTDLYGDEELERFYKTENGDAGYRADAYLNESNVVLLRPRDALVPLLEKDPRFQEIYRDRVAALFTRR